MSWAISAKSYSQRRACTLVGLDPKTYRYRSRRPDDSALRRRLRELASERRRFGYRRLLILLRRKGFEVNHKRLFRLYREERLTVRKRGGRKRALGTRAPLGLPMRPNERWSLDLASDVLTDGRRFRVLVVMEACYASCKGCAGGHDLPSSQLPDVLRPGLTSHAILRWQQEQCVGWHYIAPGKPMQNGFVESLTGRLRDECLL